MKRLLLAVTVAVCAACASPEAKGLWLTPEGSGAKVKFDVFHKPFPEIPLPNDFATRFDASSPTKRRLNASMVADTTWEQDTRAALDELDGWGTYQTVTVAFDRPLDVLDVARRHQRDDYDPSNDAVFLIDVTPDSPDFCQRVQLDMGEGNFPLTLERQSYFPNDFHNDGEQLFFEDREEDANHNGALDLGEDLDMDGVLDHPNTLAPGQGRLETMSWYERETNTLLMKPLLPLRENTTYAVVLTRRLLDEDGRPVRSPFAYVNHASQTRQLEPLAGCLPKYGLAEGDVAFTWAYSTQSITRDFKAIRDGLYGLGPMSRLSTEFPAEVKELFELKSGGTPKIRIVTGDEFRSTALELLKQLGGGTLTPSMQAIADSHRFIAFHVVFSFEAPQFFPRKDSEGNPLPLYKQRFQVDPVTGAAFTRPETVYVWLTVPKRRQGPAPAVLLGHGYTGNKLDPVFYGGFFARYGVACIGMENVSHGVPDIPEVRAAESLFTPSGLGPMYAAIVKNGRAFDQNGDGFTDSGADFWTSYMFHTRDVVRQSALDYMQLVRVLRGFDGTRRWRYDSNRNGKEDDLAGDFDGDGVLDVGASAPISMTGGSLGGIMSALMAGAEPQLEVAVPVSGAAGLPDVGVRSIQGGVGEAVNLRMMGPLLLSLRNAQGGLDVWQYLPDLNDLGKVKLAAVPATVTLKEGDTAVLFNKTSGERRCSRVLAGGLLRAAVSSDEGDELKLAVYPGPLPPQERTGCTVPEAAVPSFELEATGFDFKWYGRDHAAGEPLTALGDGFGLRRQSPEMRRLMSLAQAIIDRGDPINWVPYVERWNLRYGTGEQVRTRMVVINTIGDMNVPVATGVAISRAAGFIPLEEKDPRYGKTINRLLIDEGTIEAVERVGRFTNSAGQKVHEDIDVLQAYAGKDDGLDVPRLATPLRAVGRSERAGGWHGTLFPMVEARGRHGFDPPDPSQPFNLGAFLINTMGRYTATNGLELPLEGCAEDDSCSWIPPLPPPP